MAKGGGGGGSPSSFTGGGPSFAPGPTPSSSAPQPYYPSVLPAGGGEMATPESVAAMMAAAPPPPPMPMRNDFAQQMANPMRTQYNQLSGQDLMMMKLGQQPQNFNPQAARNDQLMRLFAGMMPGRGGRSIGSAGGGRT